MTGIVLYAKGFVCVSACAPKDTPVEAVAAKADHDWPTGLDHGWHKSRDDFRDGQPNPCPCNSDPECRHWLLNC